VEYLPRTSTFIHTLLRSQTGYRPIVLARRLSNLSEFPLDGEILELGPKETRITQLNARFPVLPEKVRDPYPRRVEARAREYGCVLLHAHFGWSGVSGIRTAERLGIPLVTTFYGLDLSHKKRRWHSRGVYEHLFARGTRFICEGPAMSAHLVELGCEPAKIRIVPVGIDLDEFPFRVRERRSPLVVLQTARLVEKKGVDLSIRAFAIASDRIGEAQLWIVGDGDLRPELEGLARSLGVADRVRFVGEISHIEYRELLEQAHVGIQPSRTASDGDTEGGAPTVLLEMQASGLPVIATRHADIPFVVAAQDGLVDEEDVPGLAAALVRVAGLREPEWAQRSAEGRRAIESLHDASVVAGLVEDVYAEVLGRDRP